MTVRTIRKTKSRNTYRNLGRISRRMWTFGRSRWWTKL